MNVGKRQYEREPIKVDPRRKRDLTALGICSASAVGLDTIFSSTISSYPYKTEFSFLYISGWIITICIVFLCYTTYHNAEVKKEIKKLKQ